MEHRTKRNHLLHELVSAYEAMLHRGDTAYLEEKNFHELICYYEEEFQLDKAIKVTEHALTQYTYCIDFYLIAARLMLQKKNYESGQQILDQAERISPNDTEIQLMKAQLLAGSGDTVEALDLLSRTKKFVSGMDKVEFYLAEASVHEAMKDFGQMFRSLSKALRLDPKNEVALEKIWMSVELTKKFEESIQIHEKVLDYDAFNSLGWFNLGHGYAGVGEYFKAINALEYAFVIDEDFELAYLDCAELCCQVQDYTKALKIYLDIAENFGAEEDLLVQIADCYIHLGDYEKAKAVLVQALKQDQYNDEVYYFLGLCFLHEKRLTNAITSFQKAIEIEDRREEYYSDLALAYARNNELGKADFYYRKSTEVGPEQEEYWIRHAQFLIRNQRPDKALYVMEDADAHAVGPRLSYCRAACFFANGLRKEGFECLEEALLEEVTSHTVLFDTWPALSEDKAVCSMIHYYEGEAAAYSTI